MGGGLPEFSFNIIAGAPGSGKTTLAHQIMFANATPERPALYFTVLGEPALKMLRYQQQFQFFDPAKLSGAIRFINLSEVVLEQDLSAVLEEIVKEVEAANPGIVVVDSFRTVVRKAQADTSAEMELQGFVQRLALHLTSWQATTFPGRGVCRGGDTRQSRLHRRRWPVLAFAERGAQLHRAQDADHETARAGVRAGPAYLPHHRQRGCKSFPRTFGLTGKKPKPRSTRRLSTGIAALDAMLDGGIPEGDSVLVAGPSGNGQIRPRHAVHCRGHPAGRAGDRRRV